MGSQPNNSVRNVTASSKAPASPPKKQEKDHNQQNDAEAAAAVVTNATAHIVAAAPEEEEKDYENNIGGMWRSLAQNTYRADTAGTKRALANEGVATSLRFPAS